MEYFTIFNPTQNLLLHFQRDRRSLVLDSARPHLAPHLVITPPDDHCQDSCPFPIDAGTRCPTHSPNFLERQCRRDLSVPRPHGRLPSHSRPRKISHSSFKGNVEYRRLPYRVFSHREFADSVRHNHSIPPSIAHIIIYFRRLQRLLKSVACSWTSRTLCRSSNVKQMFVYR